MRISELSAKTQVSVHRLRRYEAAGLIASQRLPNGYRDDDERTVRYVVFIAMSREMGFSLPVIADYLPRTLIDTACGFAAGTVAGPNLLAANFSVNCLRPAVGQKFIARARVIKPGKAQVFTSCDLFAVDAEGEKLMANGQTLLTVVAA